jgi:hypothetical protein
MRPNPMRGHAARYALAALATAAALAAAGCGGSGAASPAVPSISRSAQAAAASGGQGGAGAGASRATALHAAAQCIRQHGIPGYTDPVLTPSGEVYSDTRAFQDPPQTVVNGIHQACRALLTRANLNPFNEPPAPPQLVQAGVRSAECLRAHGLPNMRDPTARSPYTPGHGFGMSGREMPAGGKASPVWQQAARACHAQLDAEILASTLGSLGNDG